MDATLHALGQILLKAIPTFIAVIVLHLYLKVMFFKPLGKKLHERYEATEGARKLAEEAMQRADAKTAEYEKALRDARSAAYQAQEALYKEMHERETVEMAKAREQADAAIRQAREALAKDIEAARTSLSSDSEMLAAKIADALLKRSAA